MKILSQSDWRINLDDELINYLSKHNLKFSMFYHKLSTYIN